MADTNTPTNADVPAPLTERAGAVVARLDACPLSAVDSIRELAELVSLLAAAVEVTTAREA